MSGKILVTGGCGFIGSNFIAYMLKNFNAEIVNLDALTYAGNLENLKQFEGHPDYSFIRGSINDRNLIEQTIEKYNVEGIINFAAESHVDRSILDTSPFVETNIFGTITLLEAFRKYNLKKFVQVSTDEVYGSLGSVGLFTESSPICPKSPYSASKASADHFVDAFVNTYDIDASITRCSNNYGAFQFPEKLIPLMILNALGDRKLPVYGDGKNVRDWIYVDDHCEAIRKVYSHGGKGEVYNIGANAEKENIEVVKTILSLLGKDESLIEYVGDRPGHDRRYAIDSNKIHNELGWKPKVSFDHGIEKTVNWYLNNKNWWEKVISGEYQNYYKTNYGHR